jgi:methionine synthase II (cobalamin-independent)
MHKFFEVKTIEEHASGINQMLKMNKDTVVTVSDDCTMKFWNIQTMKVEDTH